MTVQKLRAFRGWTEQRVCGMRVRVSTKVTRTVSQSRAEAGRRDAQPELSAVSSMETQVIPVGEADTGRSVPSVPTTWLGWGEGNKHTNPSLLLEAGNSSSSPGSQREASGPHFLSRMGVGNGAVIFQPRKASPGKVLPPHH